MSRTAASGMIQKVPAFFAKIVGDSEPRPFRVAAIVR
jgi:hypothetical protein